jgi:hypothetical protein
MRHARGGLLRGEPGHQESKALGHLHQQVWTCFTKIRGQLAEPVMDVRGRLDVREQSQQFRDQLVWRQTRHLVVKGGEAHAHGRAIRLHVHRVVLDFLPLRGLQLSG